MLESAGFDSTSLDEGIDLVLFQTYDTPEAVSGQLTLVDEAIESARRYAQAPGRFGRAEPANLQAAHKNPTL
jgi:hypothetical protein